MKRFRCSGCQTPLAVKDERRGVISCPKCGAKMRLPEPTPVEGDSIAAGPPPRRTSAAAASKRLRRGAGRQDDDDDAPPLRRKAKSKPRPTNWILLAGLGGAAVVLALAIGTTTWLVLSRPPIDPAPQAQAGAPVAKIPVAKIPIAKIPVAKIPEENRERPAPPPDAELRPAIKGLDVGFRVPVVSLAAQDQRVRDWLAFNRQTLHDDYVKIGRKDPKWDDDVKAAMDDCVEMFGTGPASRVNWIEIGPKVKKAVDAGCDDPLVRYLHARWAERTQFEPKQRIALIHEAAVAMEKSSYSAYRKAVALMLASRCVDSDVRDEVKDAEIQRLLRSAIASTAKAANELPAGKVEEFCYTELLDAWPVLMVLHGDYPKTFEALHQMTVDHPQLQNAALKIRSERMVDYAWVARGSGVASTVTEEGWRVFHERLSESRSALDAAWKINPRDGETAAMMVQNCLASGRDNLNETRIWFDRAMNANPDNARACEQMLNYLHPKWYGSKEELVGFGQECMRSKNWRSGITLLVAEAHFAVASWPPGKFDAAYMKSPAVWRDIKTVYDDYLKHCPRNQTEHCRFACYCYYCGEIELAAKHFRAAGDGVWTKKPFDFKLMTGIRDDVLRLVPAK